VYGIDVSWPETWEAAIAPKINDKTNRFMALS
jgi:hypothetical protein